MRKYFLLALTALSAGASAQFVPLDPELKDFAYPFPVAFHEVKDQRQTLKMAYMDVKPAQPNGRTVVLLHGKNFSGYYWERTIRDLSAQGYRVVAPDQIGFGKSSKPQAFQFSFAAFARYTNDLTKELGIDRYDVVGHSMGGMIAARLTLTYPERVNKLILVNPIGLENYQTLIPYRTVDELYAGELKANEQSLRAYQQNVYFDGKWKPEYDALLKTLVGWTLHPDYPQVAWNAALTSDMIYTQPVVVDFPKIKTPTLLIIGTRDRTAPGKDRVSPEAQKALGRYDLLGKATAKAIRGSRLVEIPGVGHMPQVEAYDTYWRALSEFLRP